MSDAIKEGCFTATWDIENLDIFLRAGEDRNLDICMRAGEGQLRSAAWKTETTDGSVLWWCLSVNDCGPGLEFSLVCLNKYWTPDSCVMSFISSCGEILLKKPTEIGKDFVDFYAENEAIFSNQMLSNVPQVTLNFKFCSNTIKDGAFRIHSVLRSLEFHWNISGSTLFCPNSKYNSDSTIIGEDNLLINMTLDRQNKNELFSLCVVALPVIDGYFSFVHCKVINYVRKGMEETLCDRELKYNILCTEWRTNKVIPDTTCNLSLRLESIVAHHNDCQYNITSPTSSQTVKARSVSEAVIRSLSYDLLQLYRESTLGDATLKTLERSHSVHRSILAARSPVFRAIFEKDQMRKGCSGCVNIKDGDSETRDHMLVFLHGDSLEDMQWEEDSALHYASDKYSVLLLKLKCADILKAGLSVTNACEADVLADKHLYEQLMKYTLYFYDHQEVISSPKWEELEESNLRLSSKIVKALSMKKGQI